MWAGSSVAVSNVLVLWSTLSARAHGLPGHSLPSCSLIAFCGLTFIWAKWTFVVHLESPSGAFFAGMMGQPDGARRQNSRSAWPLLAGASMIMLQSGFFPNLPAVMGHTASSQNTSEALAELPADHDALESRDRRQATTNWAGVSACLASSTPCSRTPGGPSCFIRCVCGFSGCLPPADAAAWAIRFNNLHSCNYTTHRRTRSATDGAFAPCALNTECTTSECAQQAPTQTTDRICSSSCCNGIADPPACGTATIRDPSNVSAGRSVLDVNCSDAFAPLCPGHCAGVCLAPTGSPTSSPTPSAAPTPFGTCNGVPDPRACTSPTRVNCTDVFARVCPGHCQMHCASVSSTISATTGPPSAAPTTPPTAEPAEPTAVPTVTPTTSPTPTPTTRPPTVPTATPSAVLGATTDRCRIHTCVLDCISPCGWDEFDRCVTGKFTSAVEHASCVGCTAIAAANGGGQTGNDVSGTLTVIIVVALVVIVVVVTTVCWAVRGQRTHAHSHNLRPDMGLNPGFTIHSTTPMPGDGDNADLVGIETYDATYDVPGLANASDFAVGRDEWDARGARLPNAVRGEPATQLASTGYLSVAEGDARASETSYEVPATAAAHVGKNSVARSAAVALDPDQYVDVGVDANQTADDILFGGFRAV
eukprot:m.158041 g.158041  ORF g.158041 m.158041 type:complete len:648 (-) comp23682_c0_seq1:131-2074(-)